MCGIAGIFNYRNTLPVTMETLKAMNRELVHRGPDDEGFYIHNSVGLAFRRLSIIDLDTGNQPIHNEDKSVWVVFNGEIYNYVELARDLKEKGHAFYTKTDTEVIVHLYEEYGEDFALYLNGMYGIALWDDRKKTLLLLRDRPGIKPLYYAETQNGLIFGSEIKALLKGGADSTPDHEAVSQYLSYGYIPSPLSGFSSIRKLDAGHMLTCTDSGYREKEFWDIDITDPFPEDLDEKEIIDLFINEMTHVLLRQTRSDVPLGIFLSGGIDSALVASIASKECNLKLNAFTIGFKEESYNELDKAKIVTDRIGLRLYEYILSEEEIFKEIERIMSFLDEPLFDYSAIPVYFVSRLARAHVKTVIGGEGGDELFGGYQTHYLYKITEWYRKVPRLIRSGIKSAVDSLPESHSYLSTPYVMKRFAYGAEFPYDEAHYRWKVLFDEKEKAGLLSSDFRGRTSHSDSFHAMEKHFKKARDRGFSIQDQLMYVDFKTFLQDDPLQKTDRMSMANSLEVRVPLLDNAIIEFSRKVPLGRKIKGFQTKYLLRKALSRFQPDEIAFGKKRGFTPPMAIWIKKGLKDYVMSILSKDSLSDVEFLNYDHVVKIIDDHLHGRAENSRLIWALVVLVKWYRNYINPV